MFKSEINRRSLLKRSAGVMALAMGGGTPFLSSRNAFAQAADLAGQQLRTMFLRFYPDAAQPMEVLDQAIHS